MKPAAFDYIAPRTVDEALAALANAGGDAKVLAGGQSLMPMMNFRLVKPAVVVDINRLPGLDRIEGDGARLTLGALVRHRTTASDPAIRRHLPVVTEAMTHVAHFTVRNRGTFVGSLCHADPAGEMPMVALMLDAELRAVSVRGERRIGARDFFQGALSTALEPDELVTAVDLPMPPSGTGWGFAEFARRHGDYALAAVSVLLERRDGRARNVRIAVMGVGDGAHRVPAAEAALEGTSLDAGALGAAVEALRAGITPNTDLNASADYRRHLAGVLATRALTDGWNRAQEALP